MYNGTEHNQYQTAVSASPNYLSVGSFFITNPFYLNFLQSCQNTKHRGSLSPTGWPETVVVQVSIINSKPT